MAFSDGMICGIIRKSHSVNCKFCSKCFLIFCQNFIHESPNNTEWPVRHSYSSLSVFIGSLLFLDFGIIIAKDQGCLMIL